MYYWYCGFRVSSSPYSMTVPGWEDPTRINQAPCKRAKLREPRLLGTVGLTGMKFTQGVLVMVWLDPGSVPNRLPTKPKVRPRLSCTSYRKGDLKDGSGVRGPPGGSHRPVPACFKINEAPEEPMNGVSFISTVQRSAGPDRSTIQYADPQTRS